MKGSVIDEKVILMTDTDSVATAIVDINDGETIQRPSGETLTIGADIPFGHKIALSPISSGDPVQKYGEIIGTATESIAPGDWVHTHNLESGRGRGDRVAGDTQ